MKLGVLFSGGKDSCFALYRAMQKEDVTCLISISSKNPESYMFHTPNIHLTRLQADAISLPLVTFETEGEKEKELFDLKKAIEKAMREYKIEGVVSGAVLSVYQSTRIQKICNDLGLWCFNPLWQSDEVEYMKEFISLGFKAVISGVFAYPFDETWLGRNIDKRTLNELIILNKKFRISPIGEGGEFETFVCDGPIFAKKVKIVKAFKKYKNYSGIYAIEKAMLVKK
ncbi:MAG: TIGR00289 family protein [Candidatus Aenigmarchaeota archaeon]|nr:TIGR00289 family protein [Candidatus Aenigmarchaeota archaeon]